MLALALDEVAPGSSMRLLSTAGVTMQVGDIVVARERGLGTVEESTDNSLVVRADEETTWSISADNLDVVRPITAKDRAASLIEELANGSDATVLVEMTVGARRQVADADLL